MALTAALALGLEGALFSPLRRRGARIVLVIASFGAALALRSLIAFAWGPEPQYYTRDIAMAREILPGVRVTADQLFVLTLTAALMIGLHLLLTRTTLGRAMRAASENPALLAVTGIDPAAVARWTCLIGGGLAAVAGVFVGLTVQVRPFLGFDLLLPLFAAVILGGIGSVYGALAGSLVVGPRRGARRPPRGGGVPRRGRLPRAAGRAAGAARRHRGSGRVIGDVFAYLVFFLVIALTYALDVPRPESPVGLHRTLQRGGGRIHRRRRLYVGPPHGAADPGTVGRPGLADRRGLDGRRARGGHGGSGGRGHHLRLRHDYLAIATFGIAVTIQLLATNLVRLTGGPFGIHGVPRPFAESLASPLARNVAYLALVVGLVAAVYAALERLVRSPWGRVLRGLREDEAAAAALGKSPPAFRLQAFVIGAMVMGLAGAVYAHFVGFVAPEDFLPILTFQAWTMLVLGGSGNNRGAVVGALAVWALWSASGALLAAALPQELQARGAALQTVLIGVVLAAVLLVRPRGLLGEETVVSPHARVE